MQTDVPGTASRARRKLAIDWGNVGIRVAPLAMALGAALLLGAIMLLVLRANPFSAYASMVTGVFGSMSGFTQSLVKATPLLLVGLGICIAFRASVINIGAEGQIILGAVMGTWFALTFRDLARLAPAARRP